MTSRTLFRAAATAFVAALALAPRPALANTTEDVLGVGARNAAMGGAGTAIANDFTAVYYNVANLGYCRQSSISANLSHASYELEVRGEPDDPQLQEMRNHSRLTIGFCNRLPFGLSFGMSFGMGLQTPMTLDQTTLSNEPQFMMYGEPLEQLSIMVGLGYRITEWLSAGIGASILVNSLLSLSVEVPILVGGDLSTDIHWDLKPTAAILVGVHATPVPEMHLSAVFRSALYHDLNTPATIDVGLTDGSSGIVLPVDLFIESAAWYSPRQFAFGMAYDPVDALTVTADVTWYDWSSYPGPFLVATPAETEGGTNVARVLEFAPREDFAFNDIVVPRAGAEYRIADDTVAFRVGYAYRPSAAPPPGGATTDRDGNVIAKRSNLLDSTVHSVSLGGGYRFGVQPPEDGPVREGGAQQGEQLTEAVEQPEYGINGSVDAFVRASFMKDREIVSPTRAALGDPLDQYSFGGNIVELGLTFSLGWF